MSLLVGFATSTATATASCPPGAVLVGGGYDMGNEADGTAIVTRAIPDTSAGTYTVVFQRIAAPDQPDDDIVTAYAICTPVV